jgi:hypothetical protein
MSYLRNNSLNAGDKLRRYEKMDVASYLVCDVTFDATKPYMKLQHEDQLRLDLWLLLFFNAPQLAGGVFTLLYLRPEAHTQRRDLLDKAVPTTIRVIANHVDDGKTHRKWRPDHAVNLLQESHRCRMIRKHTHVNMGRWRRDENVSPLH